MTTPPSLHADTTAQGISFLTIVPPSTPYNVICVHGWACQATDYTYVFDEFLKDNQSQPRHIQPFAISLPGHGASSTENYPDAGIEHFARAVVDFCNELELENVILVGHSMGMRVVIEAWRLLQLQLANTSHRNGNQVKVKGLIFLDGSHYKFRKSLFPFDSRNDNGTAAAQSASLSPTEKQSAMDHAFEIMFSPTTPLDFRTSTLQHVRHIDANSKFNKDMRRSHIAYDYKELDGVLREIGEAGVPVLNVQSTDVDDSNRRVPLKDGEVTRWMALLDELVPGVKHEVVRNAGHFVHVDQPAEVARTVIEFVDGLSRADQDPKGVKEEHG